MINDNSIIEVTLKVKFIVSNPNLASQLIIDGSEIADKEGRLWTPIVCFEDISSKSNKLLSSDDDFKTKLGLEIENYYQDDIEVVNAD